LQSVLSI
ncbi:chlamydia polymorphic membrane middle domain protein, partial [Chlamydia psittaci 02DC14]